MLMAVFFLGGCSGYSQDKTFDSNNQDVTASNSDFDNITDDKELGLLLGQKIKALSDNPEMSNVIIVVNDYEITKKDVETERIMSATPHSETFEERVAKIIRDKVLETEAERLEI